MDHPRMASELFNSAGHFVVFADFSMRRKYCMTAARAARRPSMSAVHCQAQTRFPVARALPRGVASRAPKPVREAWHAMCSLTYLSALEPVWVWQLHAISGGRSHAALFNERTSGRCRTATRYSACVNSEDYPGASPSSRRPPKQRPWSATSPSTGLSLRNRSPTSPAATFTARTATAITATAPGAAFTAGIAARARSSARRTSGGPARFA